MKLAEALVLRADLQKRIFQLQSRIESNARVQEGESPAEEPQLLLQEFDRLCAELEDIVTRINRTNSMVDLGDGKTLTAALAARDITGEKRKVYAALAKAASVRQDRFTRSEVKFVSTVDVAEIQKTADRLAKDLRELDTKIQQKNWNVDLMD